MSLINFFYQKMEVHFTRLDYGLLKIYGALFGLVVGAFYPEVIQQFLWPIIGLFLLIMFRFLYLLFVKKETP